MTRAKDRQSPYRVLTSSYAIALSVAALLFVGTYFFLGNAIEQQREVAAAVDLTGKQRMLAQRIAWLADRYAERGDSLARPQLQAAAAEMAAISERLRTGRIGPQTTIDIPPEVEGIYGEQNLNDRLRTFLTNARVIAFAEIAPGEGTEERPVHDAMTGIMLEADGPLLNALDAVGAAYVRESDARIARLQKNQRITLIIVIFTLVAEAVFIFRPLVGQVTDYVDEVLEHSRRSSLARRAAQQASAAKSTFLSSMSHELRTPMTGIMGICDLLMSSPQTPEQAKMTRMLRQSAQILLDLLNDILDLAKIEAGRMTLESIDFDLASLLAEVRNLFDPGMAEKELSFTIEGAEEGRDVFRGDPKHLRQILCNLIGNAMKFTDSGRVSVRFWRDTDKDGRILLRFAVQDTGIGISEDGLSRLFRKFEQEEQSTARRYGGTGLGLAISKQLAEAMGGGIEVKSAKGAGSTFSFHVCVEAGNPAAVKAAAIATPAQAGRELSGLNLKILLAEDNLTTQFIIARMLTLWGQTVITVPDGGAAVTRAMDEEFDLILMDMQMPVMDGDEATRHIRDSNGACADTPVMALTADGIVEHHQRYLDAGCRMVLTKPIVWGDLARGIRKLAGVGADADVAPEPAPEHDPVLMIEPEAGPELAPEPEPQAAPESPAGPPSEGSSPVLNTAIFGGLKEVLPPADFAKILNQLVDALPQYRAKIEEQVSAGDYTQAQRAAHKLRGVCAQIGADDVSQMAAWIEERAPDVEAVRDAMPRLDEKIARLRTAILETTAAP